MAEIIPFSEERRRLRREQRASITARALCDVERLQPRDLLAFAWANMSVARRLARGGQRTSDAFYSLMLAHGALSRAVVEFGAPEDEWHDGQ